MVPMKFTGLISNMRILDEEKVEVMISGRGRIEGTGASNGEADCTMVVRASRASMKTFALGDLFSVELAKTELVKK